ncbi:uncharacterized protein K460DRAFT_422582 [Cucurbitaria berberidis CBS 394.84]|uniref:C3H1-type domain-containing protein n=1 Tax=Cucurbitaria berberidis CBS 394.84 TaxID=1168544 RepID=A0A9P4LCX8_9PLEO|nr:uncharacterized protein K460DRAFT_422582 [Cucurbitaria berberidis CBS 394.84]KAF1850148.1 hypothetical protein K460DRAFT_422582 [Cucurbitaria berberidis CBS 394.84]
MFFGSKSTFFDTRPRPKGPAPWSKRYVKDKSETLTTTVPSRLAPDTTLTSPIQSNDGVQPQTNTSPSSPSEEPTLAHNGIQLNPSHKRRRSRSPQPIHHNEEEYRKRQAATDRSRQRIAKMQKVHHQEQKDDYDRMRARAHKMEEERRRNATPSLYASIMSGEYKLYKPDPDRFAKSPPAPLFTPAGQSTESNTSGVQHPSALTSSKPDADSLCADDKLSSAYSGNKECQETPQNKVKSTPISPTDSGYETRSSQSPESVTLTSSPVMNSVKGKEKIAISPLGTQMSPDGQQPEQNMKKKGGYVPTGKGKGKAPDLSSRVFSKVDQTGTWVPLTIAGPSSPIRRVRQPVVEEEWDGTRGGFKPEIDMRIGGPAHTSKGGAAQVDEKTALGEKDTSPEAPVQHTNSTRELRPTPDRLGQETSAERDLVDTNDETPSSEDPVVADTKAAPIVHSDDQTWSKEVKVNTHLAAANANPEKKDKTVNRKSSVDTAPASEHQHEISKVITSFAEAVKLLETEGLKASSKLRSALKHLVQTQNTPNLERQSNLIAQVRNWLEQNVASVNLCIPQPDKDVDEEGKLKPEFFRRSPWMNWTSRTHLLVALIYLEVLLEPFAHIILAEDAKIVERAVAVLQSERKFLQGQQMSSGFKVAPGMAKVDFDSLRRDIKIIERSNVFRNELIDSTGLDPRMISQLLLVTEYMEDDIDQTQTIFQTVLNRIRGILVCNAASDNTRIGFESPAEDVSESDSEDEDEVEIFISPQANGILDGNSALGLGSSSIPTTQSRGSSVSAVSSIPSRPCLRVNKPGGCPDEDSGKCRFNHLNKGIVCLSIAKGIPCGFGDSCAYLHRTPSPAEDPKRKDLKPILDMVLKNPTVYRACLFVNTPRGCFHGAENCQYNHTLEGVSCPDDDGKGSCHRKAQCPMLHKTVCVVFLARGVCDCSSDDEYTHPPEKWQSPPPPPVQIDQQQTPGRRANLGAGAGSKRLHSDALQGEQEPPVGLNRKRQRQATPAAAAPTGPRGTLPKRARPNGAKVQQELRKKLLAQSSKKTAQPRSSAGTLQASSTTAQGDKFSVVGAAARTQSAPVATLQQQQQPHRAAQGQPGAPPRGKSHQKRKFESVGGVERVGGGVDGGVGSDAGSTRTNDDDSNPFGAKRMKRTEAAAEMAHVDNNGKASGGVKKNAGGDNGGRRDGRSGRGRGRKN